MLQHKFDLSIPPHSSLHRVSDLRDGDESMCKLRNYFNIIEDALLSGDKEQVLMCISNIILFLESVSSPIHSIPSTNAPALLLHCLQSPGYFPELPHILYCVIILLDTGAITQDSFPTTDYITFFGSLLSDIDSHSPDTILNVLIILQYLTLTPSEQCSFLELLPMCHICDFTKHSTCDDITAGFILLISSLTVHPLPPLHSRPVLHLISDLATRQLPLLIESTFYKNCFPIISNLIRTHSLDEVLFRELGLAAFTAHHLRVPPIDAQPSALSVAAALIIDCGADLDNDTADTILTMALRPRSLAEQSAALSALTGIAERSRYAALVLVERAVPHGGLIPALCALYDDLTSTAKLRALRALAALAAALSAPDALGAPDALFSVVESALAVGERPFALFALRLSVRALELTSPDSAFAAAFAARVDAGAVGNDTELRALADRCAALCG